MNEPLTTVLNSGLRVLAKMYDGRPVAVTYANRTQAYAAALKHGGTVFHRGRPFYVAMPTIRGVHTGS